MGILGRLFPSRRGAPRDPGSRTAAPDPASSGARIATEPFERLLADGRLPEAWSAALALCAGASGALAQSAADFPSRPIRLSLIHISEPTRPY